MDIRCRTKLHLRNSGTLVSKEFGQVQLGLPNAKTMTHPLIAREHLKRAKERADGLPARVCSPAFYRLQIQRLCHHVMPQYLCLTWSLLSLNCKSLLCSMFNEQTCTRFTRLLVVSMPKISLKTLYCYIFEKPKVQGHQN